MFFRSLTHPVFQEPPLDPGGRRALGDWLESQPLEELTRWTARLDAEFGRRLTVVDRQRAQRCLEVALLTGRSLSWWQRNGPPEWPPIPAREWVLELDAEELRSRIEARTERLLDAGWVEEVEALVDGGFGPDSPAMTSIGYRAVLSLTKGEVSRREAVQSILRDTWAYARRQRTWLRTQVGPQARRVDASLSVLKIADLIAADWTGP